MGVQGAQCRSEREDLHNSQITVAAIYKQLEVFMGPNLNRPMESQSEHLSTAGLTLNKPELSGAVLLRGWPVWMSDS